MTITKASISAQEARKLVLLSQRLPGMKQDGNPIQASLAAIEHLSYIQIDTISVVQRAHHHTLWNRNPRYLPSQLDQLMKEKKVFEYWSHAAAYQPMCDFRYSLPRKYEIASGKQDHWYERDKGLMKMILRRIREEGPLMAKDFEHTGVKGAEWRSKPAKRALEYLFMQGDLMVPYRNNFHKVYDLSERVIPGNIDTSMPGKDDYARYLVTRFLRANGLGQLAEFTYLRKNTKPLVAPAVKEMLSNGELMEVQCGKMSYFALPESMELLKQNLSLIKLKILSPFDNLLIQRQRAKDVFNFDYLIECYLPESRRTYGYFSLPVLWDGKLVARMDCKAERKKSILHIQHLALEPGLRKLEAFSAALCKELVLFMKFNACDSIAIHKTTPASFATSFRAQISVYF